MTVTVTHSTAPDDSFSETGAAAWSANHTLTGLGTMAEQDANNVNITGGSITGVTGVGTVTDVTGTAPIASSGGTTPAISISQATTSTDGYLSSTDWNTFNNKLSTAVTSATAGTGMSVSASTGPVTFTNTAPDQVVGLTGAGTTVVTGNYPNFTITSNDQFDGDVVGPASATDNAIARYDSTTGKLIQNSTVIIDDNGNASGVNAVAFNTTPSTVPTAEGSLYWDSADGNQTLSLVMANGDAIQQIGEEQYFRIKASDDIAEGDVVMFTGTVGASGALQGAPASGIDPSMASYIMGIATHDILENQWGYVTSFGLVRGLDTSVWSEGTILYYDPTVAGGLTATLPTAPNAKVQVCAVIHQSATVGSLFVRPSFGGILGQYEGDVQITSPANGQLLVRNETAGRWINATLTDGTGISITEGAGSVTVTNTAPDQTVSLTGAGTTSISGTYPNFTITSNDQYDGTVTSVSGTGTVSGLTLSGTVTSSGNLTLGGTLEVAGGSF